MLGRIVPSPEAVLCELHFASTYRLRRWRIAYGCLLGMSRPRGALGIRVARVAVRCRWHPVICRLPQAEAGAILLTYAHFCIWCEFKATKGMHRPWPTRCR